jgi:predicted permease
MRLLLAESATLTAIGAGLGLLFAGWASRALISRLSTSDPPITLDLSLDWRVLLFTTTTACAMALVFGVAPALRATRVDPIDALRWAGRGTTATAPHRLLNLLLVGQVAVSLVLVVAAGLLVRTARQLTHVPLGFDNQHLLTVTVTAPTVPAADRHAFYDRLIEAAAAVPGVASVGGSLDAPLTRFLAGFPLSEPGAAPLAAAETTSQMIDITPGWLAAYGTPIRAGRDFDARDRQGALPVLLVNETFARRFFPGQPLVGRTLALTADVPPTGPIALGPKTVVGIVADAVYDSIRGPVPPTIYTPLAQRQGPLFLSVFFMAVRPTTAAPADVIPGILAALRAIDPGLRLTPRPAADQVDALLAQDRLVATLSAFAGALALLMATLGLYGVTAFAVWRRRGEVGIRVALGATPATVMRLILSRVLGLVAAGVAIGAGLALWASSLIAPLLYGLPPGDPLTFLGAAVTLSTAGLLAGWVPARRAARLDPAEILRT